MNAMLIPFEGHEPQVAEDAYIAPTVVLIGRVKIAAGASVWFNSVLRGDINSIEIGENTNIQDGCMLHVTGRHGLYVAERVTVGHGAILHGCRIESDCLIAMGAVVLDHAVIGHGSIVAAGAVVSPGKEIPPYSLVMGVPGKIVRQLSEDDRGQIERGWQNYCQYSRIYRTMQAKKD